MTTGDKSSLEEPGDKEKKKFRTTTEVESNCRDKAVEASINMKRNFVKVKQKCGMLHNSRFLLSNGILNAIRPGQ